MGDARNVKFVSVDQVSARTPPDTNKCTNTRLPVCIHILAQSHFTCRDLLFMCDVASQPVVGNDVASQPVASFGRLRTNYVIAEYWLHRRGVLSMVVA